MKIDYDEKDDVLFIRFSDKPVVRDLSQGWNVVFGMAEDGIAQLTVLDAKKDGFLPLDAPDAILRRAA